MVVRYESNLWYSKVDRDGKHGAYRDPHRERAKRNSNTDVVGLLSANAKRNSVCYAKRQPRSRGYSGYKHVSAGV